MSRASALNVLAMTRSAELGERINPMFAALDGVRAETRIGDLHSVNGELVAQLERADVLLVDIDANDERELRHLGEIIQQRRGRTTILATARDLSAQGVRSLIRQGVDDSRSRSSCPTCRTRSPRRAPSCSKPAPVASPAKLSP